MTGDFCDSFGSDMHIISEDEGQSEIFITMLTPSDSVGIIEGLVEEVAYYLKKTQILYRRTILMHRFAILLFIISLSWLLIGWMGANSESLYGGQKGS